MDDVIAATGMSSSAVYRYVRSKDELIEEAAAESLANFVEVTTALLATRPVPSPRETFAAIIGELERRRDLAGYDLTKIAIQSWSEALRRPAVGQLARAFHEVTRQQFTELATHWVDDGQLSSAADVEAVGALIEMLLPGMLVTFHLGGTVDGDTMMRGLAGLGALPMKSKRPAQTAARKAVRKPRNRRAATA